jgi:ABC-2 type transport system permease protein
LRRREDEVGMGTVREIDVAAAEEPAALEAPVASPPLEIAGERELPSRVVSSRISLRARLTALWNARELFVFLVRKEVKVKYKNSALGFVWSMLNPAIVLIVYYVVFKYFLKSGIPDFALFLFSGLIAWNLLSTALPGSSAAIVANAGIVKKVAFPREILPLAQVGTASVFFFFQAIVLVLFLAGFEYAPAWDYLPVLLFALVDLIVLTAAIAVFLAAVNVYYRDVEHLVLVLLQAAFWGVPIIYSYNTVYQLLQRHGLLWLARIYLVDPIVPVLLAFQRAIYGHINPLAPQKISTIVGSRLGHQTIGTVTKLQPIQVLAEYPYHFYVVMLALVLVAAILMFLGAMVVFGRIEGNFAEEL